MASTNLAAEWLDSLIRAAMEKSPESSYVLDDVYYQVLGDAVVYETDERLLALRLSTAGTHACYSQVVATVTHLATLAQVTHYFAFNPMLTYKEDGSRDHAHIWDDERYASPKGTGLHLFHGGSPTHAQLVLYFRSIYTWARLMRALPTSREEQGREVDERRAARRAGHG